MSDIGEGKSSSSEVQVKNGTNTVSCVADSTVSNDSLTGLQVKGSSDSTEKIASSEFEITDPSPVDVSRIGINSVGELYQRQFAIKNSDGGNVSTKKDDDLRVDLVGRGSGEESTTNVLQGNESAELTSSTSQDVNIDSDNQEYSSGIEDDQTLEIKGEDEDYAVGKNWQKGDIEISHDDDSSSSDMAILKDYAVGKNLPKDDIEISHDDDSSRIDNATSRNDYAVGKNLQKGDIEISHGDDSSSSDMAILKVPLFEQPIEVEGRRSRRQAQQFQIEQTAVNVLPGKGIKLKEIQWIADYIRTPLVYDDVVKELHTFLFGRTGEPEHRINNILEFSGLPYTSSENKVVKTRSLLESFPGFRIKRMFRLLNFNLDGDKEQMCKRIMDFLFAPSANEKFKNANVHDKETRSSIAPKIQTGKSVAKKRKEPDFNVEVGVKRSRSRTSSYSDEVSTPTRAEKAINYPPIKSARTSRCAPSLDGDIPNESTDADENNETVDNCAQSSAPDEEPDAKKEDEIKSDDAPSSQDQKED